MFEYEKKSVEELLPLAKHDPEAQFQLGLHYANGDGGVRRDWTQAVKWSQRAAEQGHPGGQFNLACFYELGRGVPQDGTKAVEWYERAASQGFVMAMFNLALCYENGQIVPQDYAKAAQWYTKAAEQGDADAQYRLYLLYGSGTGVPKNELRAIDWCIKAAKQGHREAEQVLNRFDPALLPLVKSGRSAQELVGDVLASLNKIMGKDK